MGDIQTIVGKALADPKFCEILAKEPEKTLKENGVEPTAEILDALKSLDAKAIQKLAAAFGKQQAAG